MRSRKVEMVAKQLSKTTAAVGPALRIPEPSYAIQYFLLPASVQCVSREGTQ